MAYELIPDSVYVQDNDVHFSLMIDGSTQRYILSRVALEDHFGDEAGQVGDERKAFEAGLERICHVAAAKVGAGMSLGGATILLREVDFR
ncbi:DUF1488 family protein [Ralstonia solanacearum]|uniref:DUF1488 family protein n=2 Tax=Ralstonia solanacearum TaxID=305 RepID=UPI000AB83A78|nr:DUF1488 family protein [Ralstonia solanacearum]